MRTFDVVLVIRIGSHQDVMTWGIMVMNESEPQCFCDRNEEKETHQEAKEDVRQNLERARNALNDQQWQELLNIVDATARDLV